ncbi:MAG: hypothetical protein KAS72_15215, partial [Phycisphaerales bacterium]|nr:hypothetical protein [Phycisphaerales bacterium]
MERLEDRRMLASDFFITSVIPTGGDAVPFDTLEITFSDDVDQATFMLDDIQVTGSGGAITPHALTRLAGTQYSLDMTGLTDTTTLIVGIGPTIASTGGDALDQDRDGTGGEAGEDVHTAELFSADFAIAGGDVTHDGKSMFIHGGTATIDGEHDFADLVILGGATVTHSYATPADSYALQVGLTGALIIDGTSQINVTNRGYLVGRTAGNSTEGAATGQSGGSYGGLGMPDTGSANWTYGDYRDPTEPGSGGG